MRWYLVLFVLALLVPQAFSLGITPANKQVDFEPDVEKTVVYRIYNTEQKEFIAMLNVTGELKDYITLDQSQISFTADDKVKSFTLTIRFPGNVPKDAAATISVLGVPNDASSTLSLSASLGVIGATGAVVQDEPKSEGAQEPDEDKSPYLIIAGWLLLMIVAGNIAYFTYSRWTPKQAGLQEHINEVQTQVSEPEMADDVPTPIQEIPRVQSQVYTPQVQGLYFADGTPVQSVTELLYFVQNIPDDVFVSYANGQRNDFAVWTDTVLKEPRLALRIYDAANRQEIISALNFHLVAKQHDEEQKKHAAELKVEIEKLKSELDFL